jgi:hypothetical protein
MNLIVVITETVRDNMYTTGKSLLLQYFKKYMDERRWRLPQKPRVKRKVDKLKALL